MMRAGDVVIIAIVVAFGTEAVAGNAIGETLTQFNYMPVFGVATATVMLVARSLGEGDLEQIARLRKQSYCLSFVLMLPIALGIFFGGTLLTHLYTQDTKAVGASLSVVPPFLCWERRLQQERSSIQLFGKAWEMGNFHFMQRRLACGSFELEPVICLE